VVFTVCKECEGESGVESTDDKAEKEKLAVATHVNLSPKHNNQQRCCT
jgi:hypothetical protein